MVSHQLIGVSGEFTGYLAVRGGHAFLKGKFAGPILEWRHG